MDRDRRAAAVDRVPDVGGVRRVLPPRPANIRLVAGGRVLTGNPRLDDDDRECASPGGLLPAFARGPPARVRVVAVPAALVAATATAAADWRRHRLETG